MFRRREGCDMAGAAFLRASTVFFATPKHFRHKLMNQSCALVFMAKVTQPSLWQIKMEIGIPQYNGEGNVPVFIPQVIN